MVLSGDSPWHFLSWEQRNTIDAFVNTHYIRVVAWDAIPIHEFHTTIIDGVFLDWNANVKPDVPIVSYPKPKEFSISLGGTKEEAESADPPGQEVERPSKIIKRTSAADIASQSSTPSASLIVPSPCTAGPDGSTDPIRMSTGSVDSACKALVKAHMQLQCHYDQQNRQILIFLIRKYIYNSRNLEPWSPEQDGKPRVSGSDIRKAPRGSEYLNECIETMGAAMRSLKELKHHF
ncbi:hypothetical protein PG997_000546 [Apiospora hydei]|uniref:Uncharacterized protein n=1 Tax=Apiospora hydei TaxID=1337664 RepID=A0ABR1XAX1_9PEZI